MTTALDWIERYKEHLTLVKNRSNNTVLSYIRDVELLYRFVTSGMLGEPRVRLPLAASAFDWADFDEDKAVAYLSALKASGATGSTIQRKIYGFHGFFKFLRKKGAASADPFADTEFRNVHRKLPTTLSINEMNRLLTHIRQPLPALMGLPTIEAFLTVRDRAMLEILYGCGLRVSELVGMDWQHIDFSKHEVLVLGKGSKWRLVPLGAYAIQALNEYSVHYEQHWGCSAEGHACVFLSGHRRRINQRTIPRTIRKWSRLAGVRYVHPHAFRHSAATHMMEGGADIRSIQAILGHAHIATTEIYTHVATRQLKSVHANTHPRA